MNTGKHEKTEMHNVKQYVLTSNRLYTDKQTDDGVISPVQSVKGILHTKVQDSSMLSMSVGGKRVTVDVGTDAFSNISPKDKAAFSRAITDGAPITFTTTDAHVQAHIAGVTRDIIVPVNCHDKHFYLGLIDRKENMFASKNTQKGTLVDFSRYRGAVIQDADGKLVLCMGGVKDKFSDDMSKEKALIGKPVSVSIDEKTALLTIQSLEKSVEKARDATPAEHLIQTLSKETEMKTKHVFRLTSRDDLNGYTSFEKMNEQEQLQHHGAPRVAGRLIDANPHYGTFKVEHPKYGEIEVSVGKRLFLNNDAAVDTLFKACKEKKPVDISLDKTGTALTVAIKDGPTLVNKLSSPAVPYGLVDGRQVFAEKTYRGKLVAVNDEHSVDLQMDKGPLIVFGRGGTASEATLKKMLGKQVEVSAGKENALVVKSLELEKGLRR